MRHAPWDYGALAFARDLLGQETIRTACGKRVRYVAENVRDVKAGPVECPVCAEYMAYMEDATMELAAYLERGGS